MQFVDTVNTCLGVKVASKRNRQRADGTMKYEALYRLDGKQTSKSFHDAKTRDDFVKLINQIGLREALEVQDAIDENEDKPTPQLGTYAHAEVDLRTGITDRTRSDYHRQIDRDWGILKKLPLDKVTPSHVRTWVRSMERDNLSGKTIKNKHSLLASVFLTAMADPALGLTHNPCLKTKLPRADSGEEEMVFLTQSELALLLEYIPSAWKNFVMTSASVGFRFGEMVALQVKDWLPETGPYGSLRVNKALKRTPNGFIIGPPKTKKSNRTVAVAPQIATLMNEITRDRDSDELLFPSPSTGGLIKHSLFHEHIWKAAVNLANGLPPGRRKEAATATEKSLFYGMSPAKKGNRLGKFPRVHDLRHTAASWMLETTGDIQAVQYMLGHESITTTVDRYGHLVPRRQYAIAEGMKLALSTILPEIEEPDTESPKQIAS